MNRIACSLVAFTALAPIGCQETHPGEVDLHKVALEEPFLKSDRLSNTFLLRGRGFTLSENVGRIRDVFGEHEHTGPLRLLRELEDMDRECGSAEAKFAGDGRSADPRNRELAVLHEEIHGLLDTLRVKVSADYKPGAPELRVSAYAKLEVHLERVVDVVLGLSRYLQHLHDAIRQIRYDAALGRRERMRFDLIFEIGGRPVDPRDWISRNTTLRGPDLSLLLRRRFDALFDDRVLSPLEDLIRLHREHLNARVVALAAREADLRAKIESLGELLRRTTEHALNLSKAVRARRPEALRRQDEQGEAGAMDEDDIERKPQAVVEGKSLPLVDFVEVMGLDIEKMQHILTSLLLLLREPMRQLSSNFSEELASFERIARTFARLTSRNINKPLKRGSDAEPVFLTMMLKTLFVKYVEESGQSELVVTAAVKHEQNATAAAYPLIFEENFRADSFVNRKDRIMWGPAPYTGQFLDLRLTIVELDDLDNQSIVNGFANMTAAVSKFSPELSALSPALTAFVGAIVKSATKNDVELDASFTFPAPEGSDKADVDFLMTETGHYVIMKREGSNRVHVDGIPDRSQEEMLYRRLIYNPDDGRLYWRRYFSSPRSNFTPDNLFKEQTYAVIVVTDEYTSADGLGEMLQQQVAQALGQRRSQEYVPDLAHAAQILKDFRDFRREDRKFQRVKGDLSREEREARKKAIEERKDLLWGEASALRKQMVIDALYEDADAETRAALGTDLEKWKAAMLYVAPNGEVRVVAKAPRREAHALALSLERTATVNVFDARDRSLTWTFAVLKPDGQPAPEGPDAGTINKTTGEYTAPKQPAYPRVRLRATADGAVPIERDVEFVWAHALNATVEGQKVRPAPLGRSVLVTGDRTYTLEINGVPKDEKLLWWCNERVMDTVKSFVTTEPSFVESVRVDRTKANDETHRETITVTLKYGAFTGQASSVHVVGVPETFSKIFSAGVGSNVPQVDATIVFRHPLRVDTPRVVVTIDKDSVLKSVHPSALLLAFDPEYDAAEVSWTVRVRAEGAVPQGGGKDLKQIPVANAWFNGLVLQPGSGILEVKGDVKRKAAVDHVVKRTIEYRVVRE